MKENATVGASKNTNVSITGEYNINDRYLINTVAATIDVDISKFKLKRTGLRSIKEESKPKHKTQWWPFFAAWHL